MTTRIAFIRGINVGGKAAVTMAELRKALEDRGLQNVRTYIQSGNVVYDPPAGAKHTAAARRNEVVIIGDAFNAMKGFVPAVMVMPADDVAAYLVASPYAKADPSQAFLVFVDGPVSGLGDLDQYATAGEEWQAIDGVIHLHCPNGLGRSKLGGRLAASTNVSTTTRNLRTVAKVLELAGS